MPGPGSQDPEEQQPRKPEPLVKRDQRGGIKIEPATRWLQGFITRVRRLFGAEAQEKTSEVDGTAPEPHRRHSKRGSGVGLPHSTRGRTGYGNIRRTLKREGWYF